MYKVIVLDDYRKNCGEVIVRNINEANKISDNIKRDINNFGLKYTCEIEVIPSDKYKVIEEKVSLNKNGELITSIINERIIEVNK